tara:strand:+ start:121 stop:552 length:432 start_codon:yes stop_codon:yes gene_type:complete
VKKFPGFFTKNFSTGSQKNISPKKFKIFILCEATYNNTFRHLGKYFPNKRNISYNTLKIFLTTIHPTNNQRQKRYMETNSNQNSDNVKSKLLDLFDEVLQHDGFGEIRVEMKILKRHQKEVILHCGKQYRFVIDSPDTAGIKI